MKTFIAGILLSFSLCSFADTIIVDLNGVKHSCSPMQGNGGNASTCATAAYNGPFSREESVRLCQGAFSDAPAKCAIAAYNGPYTKEEAVTLCQGAYSTGPTECAVKAYNGPFSKVESVTLCSHASASVETASCAINAYNGPYSKEEAINLCKYTKSVFGGFISKSNLEKSTIMANKKAMLNNEYK